MKFKLVVTIDEGLLANIKRYRIVPSQVIKRALRQEVRLRRAEARARAKRKAQGQVVNRFSGEVLSKG
ncbi:MAG: type II toxin-antitoxin system CcdA family antitoxin [archaeon]|nr:MAG: type II toxin-antitoxin system CcdA family antitoxin [archaeon]